MAGRPRDKTRKPRKPAGSQQHEQHILIENSKNMADPAKATPCGGVHSLKRTEHVDLINNERLTQPGGGKYACISPEIYLQGDVAATPANDAGEPASRSCAELHESGVTIGTAAGQHGGNP